MRSLTGAQIKHSKFFVAQSVDNNFFAGSLGSSLKGEWPPGPASGGESKDTSVKDA
jgi:hypothetical protein